MVERKGSTGIIVATTVGRATHVVTEELGKVVVQEHIVALVVKILLVGNLQVLFIIV